MHFRLTEIIILNQTKMQQKCSKVWPFAMYVAWMEFVWTKGQWAEIPGTSDVFMWLHMKADLTA